MAMDRTALAALIERVREDEGSSYEDLAVRARRAGHAISKQHISSLVKSDPLKTIVPSTMRALADGLGVPLPRVVEAAVLSAGLPPIAPPVDWSVEAAIWADSDLPTPAKRMLLSLLETARSGRSEGRTLTSQKAARKRSSE